MLELEQKLERRRAQNLYRCRQVLESPQGPMVTVGGRRLLAFCSNDYLGLAADPRVVRAFQAGAERYGVGAGASHLVSGHSVAHQRLEEELAAFMGAPRALLFSTGYMANLAVAGALVGRRGSVYEDKLNHASLLDAARLSGAAVKRYRHGDLAQLRARLEQGSGDKLILSDGVFSMDGDLAPLPQLAALAREHGARLLVDEAHGLGVLGERGRGSLEALGVAPGPPVVVMGTLGKALGAFGAFVAGEEALVETLIQEGRTYIYTTALPPAVAEAARASLRLVRYEPWRREKLLQLVERFRAGAGQLGLALGESATPIQPVILGEAGRALAASRHLYEQGLLVTAIRPPTVPAGTARLRITFSASHEPEHVDRLLAALDGLPGK